MLGYTLMGIYTNNDENQMEKVLRRRSVDTQGIIEGLYQFNFESLRHGGAFIAWRPDVQH